MDPKEMKEQLEMFRYRLDQAYKAKDWDKVATTISEIDRLIGIINDEY